MPAAPTPRSGGPSDIPDMTRRGVLRMLGGAAVGAVVLNSTLAVAGPATSASAASAGQAGPDPVVIDQSAVTDNVTVLMATAAGRSTNFTVETLGDSRKNFYVKSFATSSDYLTWNVQVASAGSYQAALLVRTQGAETFTLAVDGTSSSVTFTTSTGWDRVSAGALSLPAGTSTIRLTRGTLNHDVDVKSVELIPSSQVAARNARIQAARADTTWLSQSGYGLMFQYGSWGAPHNVGNTKSLDQQADDFNVPAFVSMVKETGAAYVIWSISWWGYRLDAALSSPNSIVTAAGGSGGLTSSRDLIGEVAAACKAAGIRFMLYYHTGSEEYRWWPYQKWPSTFSPTGTGDRSTFFRNWKTVITEIGSRYGTNLDGFFFDDGMVLYYPAAYEDFHAAARTGNPNRLISWNSWILPAVTDFQDVLFGESSTGAVQLGSAPVGGDGRFTSGPHQGQLQHGMFMMDGDWGVHLNNTTITTDPSVTSASAIGWVTSAASRRVPLSFDLMMYEDGTVNPRDLRILNDVRQALRGTPASVPTGTTTVNDDAPGITYTGTWTRSSGRGAGDLGDDVRWTAADNASFSYSFTGTGIDVIGPKDGGGGEFTVTIDGEQIGRFSQRFTSGYQAQQVLYSARCLPPGNHTITCTKVSGSYVQLDALRTVPNPVTINDDHASITYQGAWTHSTGRGAGDYGNDVHWTATSGNSATVTFTGTGIDVLGPMSPADGLADILLDGVKVGTLNCAYPGAYAAQQFTYQVRGLQPGSHTLKLVKTGGSYLQVDAFTIWP